MSGFQILLAVLGILVALAVAALWIRHMIRTMAVVWAPNTQFLKGTYSRWRVRLRGTYHDRPVMAYLGKPDGSEFGPTTYSYIMRMTVPPGFENWALGWGLPRKGEPAAWNLKANSGPAERLKTAGLLATIEEAPKNWLLRYRAGSGRLELSIANVGMFFCPEVGAFQAQLDFLSRLANINSAAMAAV